ncbi:MAG: hypothetical protein FWF75_04620, partial [Propionibacteriaceae bacterium]|nr:hypothetical protein [Propionibacteriaceae bacterium]
ALRRHQPTPAAEPVVMALASLLGDAEVVLIGPIRQELLSGISDNLAFTRLRARLGIYPDEPLDPGDFVRAADFSNRCRRHGVQGSRTDFLLCAVADRLGVPVFTTDNDFARYARHVPVRLVPIPGQGGR